jgi:AbrB family looped-hinge helix DNA binding protein
VTENVKEIKLETKIGSNGRIMFPAYLRKALGAEVGEKVIIELKDHQLHIYKPVPLTNE